MAQTNPNEKYAGGMPPSFIAPPPHQPGVGVTAAAPTPVILTAPSTYMRPVVMYTQGSTSSVYEKYRFNAARISGGLQITFGILAILFQTAAIIVGSSVAFVGTGIWVGVFFLISGAFGIASAASKTRCLVITTMVMSIISAVFMGFMVGLGATGIAITKINGFELDEDELDREYNAHIALDAVLIAIAIAELIVAIVQAALCCEVSCGNNSNGTVLYTASAPNQMIIHGSQPQTQGYIIQAASTSATTANMQHVQILAPNQGYVNQSLTPSTQTDNAQADNAGALPIQHQAAIQPPAYNAEPLNTNSNNSNMPIVAE